MYIAAYEIHKKECDAGDLVDEVWEIPNPETIVACESGDRPSYFGSPDLENYVKRPLGERDGKVDFIFYRKRDVILVNLPPALELLYKAVSKLSPQDTLFQQLKELSER